MKSLDLRPILYCIEVQKKNGTYRNEKIGMLTDDFPDHLSHYKDEPILYSKSIYDKGTVTIEKPKDKLWLDKDETTGNHITTYCTMVGVPEKYIVEIKL